MFFKSKKFENMVIMLIMLAMMLMVLGSCASSTEIASNKTLEGTESYGVRRSVG